MSLFALAVAAMLAQQGEKQRDWGAALRMDATAVHEAIATSHPGPVNPKDPGFAARNDAEFARALARARNARSFADYFYAMQEYAAAFDDGHLGYGVWGATPDEVRLWPGFLTRYHSSGEQLVFVSERWSGVPLGARLLSCDGRKADRLARDRLGTRFGRWDLAAQREIFGDMLFFDTGNPYVKPIARCRFRHAGKTIDLRLRWQAPKENLYLRAFGQPHAAEFDWRRLENGTYWFTIPSFNGDPDSPPGKKLRELVAYVDAHAAEIRSAPGIVFDLRGNGGGSSDWSDQIARPLWGEGWMERHPEEPLTVSWRASKDNLDYLRQNYADRSKGGNLSPAATTWYKETIAGLEKAVAKGDALWVIRPEPSTPSKKALPDFHPRGPVYVVTDPKCMSACLDAVDLWTRLGAIPVGRETGADTLYMEVRQVRLPAGLGAISLPMKVYGGRARGSNQPVVPSHRFDGDLTDTAALQQWISTLPEQKARDRKAERAEDCSGRQPGCEVSFRISAEEMNGAWGAAIARAGREAAAAGLSPLEDPLPPAYSAATCRWIEPGHKARCRYRVERGLARPGQERLSVPEEGELYRTDTGWDFGS